MKSSEIIFNYYWLSLYLACENYSYNSQELFTKSTYVPNYANEANKFLCVKCNWTATVCELLALPPEIEYWRAFQL